MGRWQPGAQGRLADAALQLYAERGYEQVTVAEIAERAGVTARTFFRYFGDKREVLFAGSETMHDTLTGELAHTASTSTPLAAVAAALDAVAVVIGTDHRHSVRRQEIINANAELQERERSKLASWSSVLADGLVAQGVADRTARLAAETGVAVFRVAFERWLAGSPRRRLDTVLRESFDQLAALTALTATS